MSGINDLYMRAVSLFFSYLICVKRAYQNARIGIQNEPFVKRQFNTIKLYDVRRKTSPRCAIVPNLLE